MLPARLIGGVSLMLTLASLAPAQTLTEKIIGVPEVEVRSGGSPQFYATSKLYQGNRVQVVGEEGKWLAIKPPDGSFNWINARFLEIKGMDAIVKGKDVPLRIGSSLVNSVPNVISREKLQEGTTVRILDPKPMDSDDGRWMMIYPPAKEVRFIPMESVSTTPVVTSNSAPTGGGVPVGGVGVGVIGGGGDPLWAQAQQAERAGNMAEAERLYTQLAKTTKDHGLQIQCWNRVNGLRQGTLTSYSGGLNRPGYVTQSMTIPRATSQYTYAPDRPAGQQPVPVPQAQWNATPGILRSAAFFIEGKKAYALETQQGAPRLYITAQPGLNLEPFVNRTVNLYGTIVYHGELKTNYMRATNAQLVP